MRLFCTLVFLASVGPGLAAADPADEIAAGVTAACPLAEPGDEAARQECAAKLAQLEVLDRAMHEPFLWGAQAKAGVFELDRSHLTKFNPLVWRRMYLSLFMFTGEARMEQVGATTVLRLPARFRNALDAGSYPYPFWHSEKKWSHYELSTEVLLVIQDGKVKGAMRSAETDAARPRLARAWDGKWTWKAGKEPRATLYRNLFSRNNPHVSRVETAYRKLEKVMRPHGCVTCHSPNNSMDMNPLELLVYPNQALAGRHVIVQQIEKQTMPPETVNAPAGIRDDVERRRVLRVAREFEKAAEAALAFERKKLGGAAPVVAAD
jgi:hypothetical protein